jgi:hypothetical protein
MANAFELAWQAKHREGEQVVMFSLDEFVRCFGVPPILRGIEEVLGRYGISDLTPNFRDINFIVGPAISRALADAAAPPARVVPLRLTHPAAATLEVLAPAGTMIDYEKECARDAKRIEDRLARQLERAKEAARSSGSPDEDPARKKRYVM